MTQIHKFTHAGLGDAPFRVIGFYTSPPPSLLEQNPTAYNNAVAEKPKGVTCGSCAYCGTPLVNNFIIQSSDGKKFSVGSECVRKTGDKGLVNKIALLRAEARREARLEAQHQQYLAALESQREANGGLTNAEVMEIKRKAALELRAPLEEQIVTALKPFISGLHMAGGEFARDMKNNLEQCNLDLSPRTLTIILEIASKHDGYTQYRKGSKKYDERYDMLSVILDKAIEDYKNLPAIP